MFAVKAHVDLRPFFFSLTLLRGLAAAIPDCVFEFLATYVWHQLLRDMPPLHFHFLRDKRSGELGFLAALGCFFHLASERLQ